jgi:NAD(P)-dependent dehydrogenase (short-subunit alcohol dehydrogenase family)
VPIGRYADPEEVADAILSLVLPSNTYMTGAVLTVDGGLTVQNT